MSTEQKELEKLREKVLVYEALLHKIQLHAEVTMNPDAVKKLIGNICNWSRAHRSGEGLDDEDRDALIEHEFYRLPRL